VRKFPSPFKRYPCDAQSRGEEGVMQLSFTVDVVMSMIEQAQPLPPFPTSMPQAKLDLTVPTFRCE
jgi:hypothetical protein